MFWQKQAVLRWLNHSWAAEFKVLVWQSSVLTVCEAIMAKGKEAGMTFQTQAQIDFSVGSSGGLDGKGFSCNAGNLGLIPESGRFPGEGNGYPPQYSCLENSMDRED